MKWTEVQQKVIDVRNKNLLVAAAAGSGKTAVLVERIISMISEGDNPIDIDHMLVVTFTNAAAAQMRDRIGKALDKKLMANPDQSHIQRQVSLLQSANITTIHSFCLNVIRNYFHRIDLDPSFKLADEAENTLMKSDVMADVLERWYEEGREEFHEFIESYARSKTDFTIEELVLQLYHFSMSNPWPKPWLDQLLQSFELASVEELEQRKWMGDLLAYVKCILEDLCQKNARAIEICNEFDGPAAYLPALISDRAIIYQLMEATTYEECAAMFPTIAYARLSTKKEEGVLVEKKDQVKALREDVKKGIKDLTAQFFYQSPEEMVADMQNVSRVMKVLVDLTKDFMNSFTAKKEEKNLIDFNDLEHFALSILVEEVEGNMVPTKAAMELSELFEEILIDEYQDSNLVQETILQSISRERLGKPNRFMVGDVKQSIYKFRLAMPELFMEKYKNYSTEDVLEDGEINYYQRIDLDKNFRSRRVVLDSVNSIFEQIMQESVGGIHYDLAASLKYGELFEELVEKRMVEEESFESLITEETMGRISTDTELILVTEEEEDTPSSEEETNESVEDISEEELVYNKKELEARAIAKRIKDLVNPDHGLMVFDNNSMSHRPARLKDIVILLRSMTGWSDVFVNVLMQEGIPAYADTSTGYFQTVEIMTIINMLRVIDNPRQDIPLTGALYSPMFGFTTTDLAKLRIGSRRTSIYQSLLTYVNGDEDKPSEFSLREKILSFLELLEELRGKVAYTPIHELIEEVLEKTGYYYYVLAMPGGERRQANMDMLINYAIKFEKGSYSGLFHFIRYIEKLNQYEVNFGEASTVGEQDDTVRIMSIHKSKGLEFPVVIVGGLSKQFNTQDLRSNIVIHSEYGIGPDYIDYKNRTKISTLLKKFIQKKMQVENLGEELRVLYVAMTRAKEKLIMTGTLKSKDRISGKDYSFYELISAKSYLDYVLPSMVNHMGGLPLDMEYPIEYKKGNFSISIIHRKDLIQAELVKQIFVQQDEEELKKMTMESVYDEQLREEIKERFEYTYPYEQIAGLKVKLTVSELKRMGQRMDEEDSVQLYGEEIPLIMKEEGESSTFQEDGTIPDFIRGITKELNPMAKGLLYHKVLELLDLSKVMTKDDVLASIEDMIANQHIREEDVSRIKTHYIVRFVESSLANRMRKAISRGQLYREKQFVMGVKASELFPGQTDEELVLIQGIIDTFFEEEDGIVLVDYKSDYVQSELELIDRYKLQLDYYQRAIEQIWKKPVKERIIYSLSMGKEIRC